VAGLVLVDGVHPDYYARRLALLERLLPPAAYETFKEGALTLPPRLVDPEQFDVTASLAQVRQSLALRPLAPMPLAVLSHGVAAPPPPGYPNWPTAQDEQLWSELQDELAALEPGSTHRVVGDSDHDIPLNRPGVVVDTIGSVIVRTRAAADRRDAH